MEQDNTGSPEAGVFDGAVWFDPIEAGVRERVRGLIETMLEEELTAALGRERYRRGGEATAGYRHGVRHRRLLGSFGPLAITVPRGAACLGAKGARWNGAVPSCPATPA